jgi:hypothetical protein
VLLDLAAPVRRPHPDETRVEVNVRPGEREQLAEAQAETRGDRQRLTCVPPGRLVDHG